MRNGRIRDIVRMRIVRAGELSRSAEGIGRHGQGDLRAEYALLTASTMDGRALFKVRTLFVSPPVSVELADQGDPS